MFMRFTENDTSAFDGVDFDEPMEVGFEEEKTDVKGDPEPEPKTVMEMAAVKAQPEAKTQDPLLL